MSDLISRQAVIDILKKNVSKDIEEVVITDKHIKLIESVPTSYSVEKVVEKMKERVEKFDCIKCKHYDDEKYVCNAEKSCRDYTFECLYDIVKAGGAS